MHAEHTTVAPVYTLAIREGHMGLWDGRRFWSRSFLERAYTEAHTTVTALEAAAPHDPQIARMLPALWWGLGRIGRLLDLLSVCPTPPVPHRVERIGAPAGPVDSLHCWTCDCHIERPLRLDAAPDPVWEQAQAAFRVAHPSEEGAL